MQSKSKSAKVLVRQVAHLEPENENHGFSLDRYHSLFFLLSRPALGDAHAAFPAILAFRFPANENFSFSKEIPMMLTQEQRANEGDLADSEGEAGRGTCERTGR
jgi:hypothetical protein